MNEKLTVLMCAYKENENDIRAAIESILNQSYTNFQFIIILDNPDNLYLRNILFDYKERDERIKVYVNEKNIGLANSLNRGLQLADTNLIVRMDADDISDRTRIEEEYRFMVNNPQYQVVSVNKVYINNKGEIIGLGGKVPSKDKCIVKSLQYVNIVTHPGVMYKRNYVIDLGGYREVVPAEDHDLWLRVISKGGKIGILDKPLLKYRISDSSISKSSAMKMWYTDEYVISLYRERKKNNEDSFSLDGLSKYLEAKGCNSAEKQTLFMESKLLIDSFREDFRNGKPKVGKIIRAIVCYPPIIKMIYSLMLQKLISRC